MFGSPGRRKYACSELTVPCSGIDRAGRGHERLAGDLAAEHALSILVRADAPEDVDLDRLEVEERDELVDLALRHPSSLAQGKSGAGSPKVTAYVDTHSPRGSAGAPRPRRTRSKAATGTTTGGNGSTRPGRVASSRAATAATRGTVGRRMWRCPPTSASTTSASRSSGARIEPEEGEWSIAAVDHYRRECDALLEAGVDPVVTFHHFTTPRWLAAKGGWTQPSTADAFARYCEFVAGRLDGSLRRACTINEPNIVSTMGHHGGRVPARLA